MFYGWFVVAAAFAVLPAVVTDHFGGKNISGIIGILYTSVALGTLLGPSAAGFVYDVSGSYFLPIAASAAANVLAAAIAVASGRTHARP